MAPPWLSGRHHRRFEHALSAALAMALLRDPPPEAGVEHSVASTSASREQSESDASDDEGEPDDGGGHRVWRPGQIP